MVPLTWNNQAFQKNLSMWIDVRGLKFIRRLNDNLAHLYKEKGLLPIQKVYPPLIGMRMGRGRGRLKGQGSNWRCCRGTQRGTKSYYTVKTRSFIIGEDQVQHLVTPKEMSAWWTIGIGRETRDHPILQGTRAISL